jgi:hypothetical protein
LSCMEHFDRVLDEALAEVERPTGAVPTGPDLVRADGRLEAEAGADTGYLYGHGRYLRGHEPIRAGRA